MEADEENESISSEDSGLRIRDLTVGINIPDLNLGQTVNDQGPSTQLTIGQIDIPMLTQ